MKKRDKEIVVRVGGYFLMFILCVNLAVRVVGESHGNVLSPFFLREKIVALIKFGVHGVSELGCRHTTDMKSLLRKAAQRHRIPSDFVLAVARTESALKPHRISPAGAMGLMQLMPGTAHDLKVGDPFDPAESADGGVRYLRKLWLRYGGNRCRVAAAYNAGPGAVPKSGPLNLPRETRNYILKVLGSRASNASC